MNETPTTRVSDNALRDTRVVAHLPYQMSNIKGDTQVSTIVTARIDGKWVCGFDIRTRTFGIEVGVRAIPLMRFDTEHAAVCATIMRIWQEAVGIKSVEDRSFILRLCNLAYDNISPKLF